MEKEKDDTRYYFKGLRKLLKKELTKSRYEHVLGVEYISAALAMRYGVDVFQAETAGLMHDCAKCISGSDMLKQCEKYHLPISETERKSTYLLHGKLGAYYCKHRYDINDPEILSAITFHTTGKPAMSMLEKIIYVADYIEPRRDRAPNLASIRQMAFMDLDETIYMITRDTLSYLDNENVDAQDCIDNLTQETYEYYKRIHQLKKERSEEI